MLNGTLSHMRGINDGGASLLDLKRNNIAIARYISAPQKSIEWTVCGTKPMTRLYTAVPGPMKVLSLTQYKYFVNVVDEYSWYTLIGSYTGKAKF